MIVSICYYHMGLLTVDWNRNNCWETRTILFPFIDKHIQTFVQWLVDSGKKERRTALYLHSVKRKKADFCANPRTMRNAATQENPLMSIDIDLQQIYDLKEYGSCSIYGIYRMGVLYASGTIFFFSIFSQLAFFHFILFCCCFFSFLSFFV